MFAPLNSAPLNSGATGLWASGVIAAEAAISVSTTVVSIRAITAPDLRANSEATAVAVRVVPANAPLASITATAQWESTRLAIVTGLAAPTVAASLSTDRTAYAYASPVAESLGSGDNARRTQLDEQLVATAATQADGLKPVFLDGVVSAGPVSIVAAGIIKTTASLIDAQAESLASADRVVVPTATSAGEVGSAASASRLAFLDAVAVPTVEMAVGDPTVTATRPVHVDGIAEAIIQPMDVVAERTAWAKLVTGRTQSISWIGESSQRVLRVRQIPSTATLVARARTRAVPNSTLGYSVTQATSEAHSPALRISRVRGVSGVMIAGVMTVTRPERIIVRAGNPIGEAFANFSPTIVRLGVAYSYADSRAESTSTQRCSAYSITQGPLRPAAVSAGAECKAFALWHVTGATPARAGASLRLRINPWVFATAVGAPRAEAHSTLRHYRSVYASAELEAGADSQCDDLIHYRWTPVTSAREPAEATQAISVVQYRWVGVEPIAVAVSDAVGDALNLRWVGMQGESASTAVAAGDVINLRWVGMGGKAHNVAAGEADNWVLFSSPHGRATPDATSVAIGRRHHDSYGAMAATATMGVVSAKVHTQLPVRDESIACDAESVANATRMVLAGYTAATIVASTGRTSYSINAGAPASALRTIVVPSTDRTAVVLASNREYQVA